jgi:hypothetical protein
MLRFDMDKGNSARSILLALGMGDYNATLVIRYLFMAPAQTDPQMQGVILLTRHLQAMMKSMGAALPVTGTIDGAWEPYFRQISGPNWQDVPWAEIARDVLAAKADGRRLELRSAQVVIERGGLDGVMDSLPKVPGGVFTYALGGFLLWRYMKRKR